MRASSTTVVRTFASFGTAALLLAACDPNVVIGRKFALAAAGTSGDSGGETGGSAGNNGVGGVGATGGVPAAGTGGSAAGTGGTSDAGEAGAAGAEDPGILFEAGHEEGSLAEWDSGSDADAGGYYADVGVESPQYDADFAHSGSGSARVTIDTAGGDTISRLYRRVDQNDAYYSAWFRLGEDHTPGRWWSVFLFRAVKDRTKSVDLWSVNLVRRDDDKLTLSVFDHETNESIPMDAEPVVEIGTWFQLTAHLVLNDGEPSQVEFWLDGEPVLQLAAAAEPPVGEPVYWVIGNGGATMSPATSTVHIDDALVSLRLPNR